MDDKRSRVDANGKAVNPYIPKFISNAPWYSSKKDDDEDYLAHQRQDPSKPVESHLEPKAGLGIVDEVITRKRSSEFDDDTKYKKVRVFPQNACTNCGSMNHLKKDCLEKPRKVNAKAMGVVMDLQFEKLKNISDWDSKRDRWNGYDAEKDWDNQVKHWKLKEENLLNKVKDDEEIDEDEAEEMAELGLINIEKKEKIINLMEKPEKLPVRSREDKPIYLTRLGGEVTYNPKSRTDRSTELGYVDDHNQFVRHLNGELQEYERLKKFAWDLNKNYQLDNKDLKHLDKHVEASPTLALLEMKRQDNYLKQIRQLKKLELLAKYGEISKPAPLVSKKVVEEEVAAAPKEEEYDFSDIYNPKLKKSMYEEDVHPGNHHSVWGSFWKDGKWGYACCQQFMKNSYCTK